MQIPGRCKTITCGPYWPGGRLWSEEGSQRAVNGSIKQPTKGAVCCSRKQKKALDRLSGSHPTNRQNTKTYPFSIDQCNKGIKCIMNKWYETINIAAKGVNIFIRFNLVIRVQFIQIICPCLSNTGPFFPPKPSHEPKRALASDTPSSKGTLLPNHAMEDYTKQSAGPRW